MARWSRYIAIAVETVLIATLLIASICLAREPLQAGVIPKLARYFADHALLLSAALGALGTLTMAVIQTIKDLAPALRWYQEIKTRHWLRLKAAEAAEAARRAERHPEQRFSPREIVKDRLVQPRAFARLAPELHQALYQPFDATDENTALDAEGDLLRLATAGDRRAFYDLPIEQLCGQMNAAAQVVLDYPELHESLLKCLASLAAPADLAEFLDLERRNQIAALRNKNRSDAAEEDRFRTLQQRAADVRARIASQTHRGVDAFQIAVGYRWNWYLRVASFLISFAITVVTLKAGVGPELIRSSSARDNWAVIVLIGLIGGFLAPVASDVQAIVRQIRQKT